MPKYLPAPEVEEIGRDLIRKHYEEITKQQVKVLFVFVDETPKKNGKSVWGTCRKVSGLAAFMLNFKDAKNRLPSRTEFPDGKRKPDEPKPKNPEDSDNEAFYLITISQPVWRRLNAKQKRALVHHELMHIDVYFDYDRCKLTLGTCGHDFEGFREEIKLYGPWRDDAVEMMETMRDAMADPQMDLPLAGEAAQASDELTHNVKAIIKKRLDDVAARGKRQTGQVVH